MKTIGKTIFLFLVISLVSCGDDTEIVNVSGDRLEGPEWLVQVVDSVGHTYNPSPVTGEYPYPQVYLVSYKGEDYFLVEDMLESCLTCGRLYFKASGDPVVAPEGTDTGLYWELWQAERKLIWSRMD
ncbi:hypothetical protein [Parabacteroides sp.]